MLDRLRRLCALALLGVCGCGSDTVVQGGGATETGNGVRIRVLDAAGSPKADALVRLIRTDTWLSEVAATGRPELRTARTDAHGEVRLDPPTRGSWAATAGDGSEAGWISLGSDTSPQDLRLSVPRLLRSRIPGGAGVSSLCAVGTDWCAQPDSQGRYALSLPPGSWALAARLGTDLSPLGVLTVHSGGTLDTSTPLRAQRLVVDDFSSGNSLSQLFPYAGMGAWYVNSWGADSIKIAYDEKLSMSYSASDTILSALVGLAFRDRTGFHALDLSRMDSLCFDARSNGRTMFYLIHYDSLGGWVGSAHATLATTDTSWHRSCLTPSSFGEDWEAMRQVVNDFAFVTRSGSFLELRNVVLWGVPLQALSR